MNKFVKFGASALLALFVVACGQKVDPKADFKTLTEWAQNNQQAISTAQQEVLTATQKDPANLETAANNLQAKIAESKKSLEALKINSPEVKALKDKMAVTFTLSSELITEGLKATQHPEQVDQKMLAEKAQKTQESVIELQKLQAELQQKFGEQAK